MSHDLHSLHIVFMIAGFIMELSPFPSGFGRPPPEPLRGTQLLCGRPGGAIVQNVMGMASETMRISDLTLKSLGFLALMKP